MRAFTLKYKKKALKKIHHDTTLTGIMSCPVRKLGKVLGGAKIIV